jgi:DNA-directed RNA polymerase specialized sigma24 family protein
MPHPICADAKTCEREQGEDRSSVRSWLYQIATHACLTALARQRRRMLPSGMYGPEPHPGAAPEEAGPQAACWNRSQTRW